MKTNKVTKLGISLLSVAALGVVAPALIDTPIFGVAVVKAEERGSLNYRISYYDGETGEEIAAKKTGVINPGETINVYKDIDGYEVTSKSSRLPNYEATYDIVARNFHGDPDGYKGFHLDYKKLDADVKPSETPKPEVKPETKPSDTPKPEVKPEPKPSDTSKPEVKPELKPQTNSNTAPTAPVKPGGQTKNSKADKPTSKKETPALPNTGEQSSSLSLVGLLLASLGLAGLTYKGRH